MRSHLTHIPYAIAYLFAALDNLSTCIYNVITINFPSDLNMGAAIRTRIVKIGNSQGIRIPKPLLEQSRY